MVKGVNKSVIEINETGNKFFNKVILFVSPEYSDKSDKQLAGEASALIQRLQSSSRESLRKAILKERKRRRRIAIGSIIGVIVIAGIVLMSIL